MAVGTLSPTSFTRNYGSPYSLTTTLSLEKGDLLAFDQLSISNVSPSSFTVSASGNVSMGTITMTVTGSTPGTTVTFALSAMVRYDDAGQINQGTITQNFSLTIGAAVPTVDVLPVLRSDQQWTGSQIRLIASAGQVTGGTMYYKATTSATPPVYDNTWSLLYRDIKETDIDTYYVWYYVVGTSPYSDIGATLIGTIDITKATPVYTAPTAVSSALTYNGSSQSLLSSNGSVSTGGVMYYAHSTSSTPPPASSSLWKVSPTTMSETDAGTYYCYFKIDGYTNYADVAPTAITNSPVEIKKANPTWTATLTPTKIGYYEQATITVNDGSQFNNISASTSFTGLLITKSGLVFTITSSSTPGQAVITVSSDGNNNYKPGSVTLTLNISEWELCQTRRIYYNVSWRTATPFICLGGNTWAEATPFIHK